RWLIAGSVAELLIALPSHVVLRQRQECCAPMITSAGLATGLATLLVALGPGVLFLYRARLRQRRPARRGAAALAGARWRSGKGPRDEEVSGPRVTCDGDD